MTLFNYIWPVILVVTANVFYHISAKSIPAYVNPLASLILTYVVAAITTTILYYTTSTVKNLATEYNHLDWTAFALGGAIVGLEFGFIAMYRAGWNIGVGSLVANIILAIVLIIIGFILYNENISMKQITGIILCIIGLILINK